MKKTGYLRDNKVLTQFGVQLRRLRLKKKLSQEELALEADITVTYISKLEHGKINTSLSHLAALAYALDVKLSVLLDFSDE